MVSGGRRPWPWGSRGWTVVINYKSNAAAAAETLAALEGAGGRGLLVQADVADADGRRRIVEETLARLGRIDLLVNNAGMAPRVRADILAMSEESYDEVMAANLKGPFFLTQMVACVMIDLQRQGVVERPGIVNIGSMSAYTTSTDRAEYCLSKAGVSMMTRLFADRLAGHGINVYEIRPGIIRTDMTRAAKEKYDRPHRRRADPDRALGGARRRCARRGGRRRGLSALFDGRGHQRGRRHPPAASVLKEQPRSGDT